MSRDAPVLIRGHGMLWTSAALFASVAVLLTVDPLRFENPVTAPAHVPASVTDTTPVRQPPSRPRYQLGEFTFTCSECHRTEPSPRVVGKGLTTHAKIHMAHGINKRCLNCHHPVNREAFVDDDGGEIPWDQPQLVCAKCHGPVYRDWQHGSHGRINGYWDKSRGEQVRLKCVACHDPHHPPFPPLPSAPGPRTLHVKPHSRGRHEGTRNILRIWEITRTSEAQPKGGTNNE